MNVLQGKMTVPSGPHVKTSGARTLVFVWLDLLTTTQKDLDEPVRVGEKPRSHHSYAKQDISVTSEPSLLQQLLALKQRHQP